MYKNGNSIVQMYLGCAKTGVGAEGNLDPGLINVSYIRQDIYKHVRHVITKEVLAEYTPCTIYRSTKSQASGTFPS